MVSERRVPPDTDRSSSFGRAAADYDRIRPSPPAGVLCWMLAGVRGVVLDLAAGTGQISRMLADPALTVLAVEPDEHMRALLRLRCPHASVLGGRAENLPLETGSVDAIVVGSAWHWFDPVAAVGETARVLRPGGRLAVVSTVPDPSSDWIAAMLDGDRPVGGGAGARSDALVESGYFSGAETCQDDIEVSVALQDVMTLFCTSSRYLVAGPDERKRLLARWHEVLAVRQSISGHVRLPLRAWAWRVTRLPVVGPSPPAGAGAALLPLR